MFKYFVHIVHSFVWGTNNLHGSEILKQNSEKWSKESEVDKWLLYMIAIRRCEVHKNDKFGRFSRSGTSGPWPWKWRHCDISKSRHNPRFQKNCKVCTSCVNLKYRNGKFLEYRFITDFRECCRLGSYCERYQTSFTFMWRHMHRNKFLYNKTN
jgi:hypothetical protein